METEITPSSGKDCGKIRRRLCRIHPAASKVREAVTQQESLNRQTLPVPVVAEPVNSNAFQNFGTVPVKSNVFQNVVISPDVLKQELILQSQKDEINLKLSQNLKSLRQINDRFEILLQRIQGASKETRGIIPRRRKIPFHELVSSAREFLEKREREKKKAKESILTDFNALKAALPTLEQSGEKKNKDEAKSRAAKSFSKQDAEMMEDIETYQQILNNAEYAADPIGTITAQLRQRIESGSL